MQRIYDLISLLVYMFFVAAAWLSLLLPLLLGAFLSAAGLSRVPRWKKARKKVALAVFSVVLALEAAATVYLAYHPRYVCPEEYAPYVSEEMQARITAAHAGFYSLALPIFPSEIRIKNATEDTLVVEVQFPLWVSYVMHYGPDGLFTEGLWS